MAMSRTSKKHRNSLRAAATAEAVSKSTAPPASDSAIRAANRSSTGLDAEGASTAVMDAVVHAITEPLGIADDGRHHPRVELHVEIDLHSESHFFSGLSGDVSEGGLFAQTYRPLTIGQEVDVAFVLDGQDVRARAVVRWGRERTAHAEPGFGLEFVELPEEGRALVGAFCRTRSPLYYDVV
jgi:uncharacterized protein (TIGR02266 family)